MAYTTKPMLGNYVVFVRTTPAKWTALPLAERDANTLYFVADTGVTNGSLWLGNTLISDGGLQVTTKLSELEDVIISGGLRPNSILMYSKDSNDEYAWRPTTLDQIFNLMVDTFTGAIAEDTASSIAGQAGTAGLVPAPTASDAKLFLRGDATWADPTAELSATVGDIDDRLTTVENTLDTLLGSDASTGKTIRDIAAEEAADAASAAVAEIVNGADESFDTLKEIADWIQENKGVEDYVNLEARVGDLEELVNGTVKMEGGEPVADGEGNLVRNEDGLVSNVTNILQILNGDAIETGLIEKVDSLSGLEAVVNNLNDSIIPGIKNDVKDAKDSITDIYERLCWHSLEEEVAE